MDSSSRGVFRGGDENKIVSKIVQCKQFASQLLANCGGCVNKAIAKFCCNSTAAIGVASTSRNYEVGKATGNIDDKNKAITVASISSVLKREKEDNVIDTDIESEDDTVDSAYSEEGGYRKITVLPARNFDEDSEKEREFRIAESQFLRMLGGWNNYEIKNIDIVQNDKLK